MTGLQGKRSAGQGDVDQGVGFWDVGQGVGLRDLVKARRR